jgi:hypothetical protein
MKKKLAETAKEFDRRFEAGEDVHDLIAMSKATVLRSGKKTRITLDVPEPLVREIDAIRHEIRVDRGALIKVWLQGRVKKENVVS